MKHYLIDKEFGTDLTNDFIAFTNENQGDITVYLDSNGGEFPTAQVIAYIINLEPERFTMVAVNAIRSSAFALFFSVKCKRIIFEDTTGLHHLMGRTARLMSNGVHSDEIERFEFMRLKNGCAKEVDFCKSIGFSEKELRGFRSGRDVLFSNERLTELLNNQNL